MKNKKVKKMVDDVRFQMVIDWGNKNSDLAKAGFVPGFGQSFSKKNYPDLNKIIDNFAKKNPMLFGQVGGVLEKDEEECFVRIHDEQRRLAWEEFSNSLPDMNGKFAKRKPGE